MDFLKEIKDGSIIITPSSQKQSILKEIDKNYTLLNIKIMSLEEFVKSCEFDVTKETYHYLINQKQIPLSIAKIYLKNMYYLESKQYESDRINKLISLKQELSEKHLLKKDLLFKKSLKQRPIIVYGYDFLLKEERKLIDSFENSTVLNPKEFPSKSLTVYKFQTIEEELEYIFQKICDLLSKGIFPHQIKLAGVTEEYKGLLPDFAKRYHIPLRIPQNISLYETSIGKTVINQIQEGKLYEEIIESLKEIGDPEIEAQIIEIFNQYIYVDNIPKELTPLLIEDFQRTYLKEARYEEEIEVISLKNNTFNSSDYVFVMGFNNNAFPIIYKDEEYLSDALKQELGYTTSTERNKLEKKALMNKLFSISNLTITYKLKTAFDTYYPSILIEDYQMNEQEGEVIFDVHYSKEQDTLNLTSMLDMLIKSGKKHPQLEKYYNTIELPYRTYDNSYQQINIEELTEHLNRKLTLSYSALDCYNHCAFRYYLQNILKITKFEDTLSIKIGNIFHKFLSVAFQESFCFEEAYQRECQALELTKKEAFYLKKLQPELKFIIDVIKEQNRLIGFNNSLYEEKIFISIPSFIPVTFMGIVDKILWQEKNGQMLVSIIDYKTGSTNLDLRLAPHGLSLQLPTYMYLVKHHPDFSNSKICGIYLQKILNAHPQNSKNLEQEKKDALKLKGYTIDEEQLLEIWDPTYENSEVIKSLKKTKNGWYHYAKLLNEEEINHLLKLTEEKIEEGASQILQGKFPINPKRVEGKNIGCEFCNFKDICYQKEKDITDIEIEKDLSFLKNEN